jgi:hypothetical protein
MKTKSYVWIFLLVAAVALCLGATLKISDFPRTTTLASNDLFLIASSSPSTNKAVKFYDLKSQIVSSNSTPVTNITLYVTTNYVTEMSVTNLIASFITVIQQTVSNLFVNNSKNGNIYVTNNVLFPWTTLTLTGTNVSTVSLTNTFFKLVLTTNAFFGTATTFPGTNQAHSFQIAVRQDSTGGRGVTFTNGSYEMNGFGTSSNATPALNTNANAVTIISFVSSPFDLTKLYGSSPVTIGP